MRESGQRNTARQTETQTEKRAFVLCSVDSLIRPEPVMTTGSGCLTDSDKPLKDPSLYGPNEREVAFKLPV